LRKSQEDTFYNCWVVSNGTAGTENQALGLAKALSRQVALNIHIKHIAVREPWRSLPRTFWPDPFTLLSRSKHLLRPPFPELWIATGRETVPLTIAVKQRCEDIFTVQTQDPKRPVHLFDMVVSPTHDKLAGDNVFPIIGAPTPLTLETINEAALKLDDRFTQMDGPKLAVLIGGANRTMNMDSSVLHTIISQLEKLQQRGFGLMITTSRRTDEKDVDLIKEQIKGDRVTFFDMRMGNKLINPYPGILGIVDAILVTEDSVNMISEAIISQKPVYTLSLGGKPGKFSIFHQQLRDKNIIRSFEGDIDTWTYEPFIETERAADAILKAWSPGTALE